MNRYKIVLFQDNTYEVLGYGVEDEDFDPDQGLNQFDYNRAEGIYQGSMEQCVAYVNARENGWL